LDWRFDGLNLTWRALGNRLRDMKGLILIFALLGAFFRPWSALPQETITIPAKVDVEAKLKETKGRDKIVSKYDRFKDYTVVACKPFDFLTTGEHMAVGFAHGMRGPSGRGPSIIRAFGRQFRLINESAKEMRA
jgi:hypothetical protein